tara:strand:+ start:509 stop:1102 length:594 start_codon:yes stop_codon:yes gene_type:complete
MKIEYPDGATPLDPDEMEGLKFKHVTTRGELDHLEQANIQGGLAWLSKSRKKNILTEGFVCKLHEKLFGEVWTWAGSFRRSGKNIGVDPIQISVQLRTLLDDMQYWIVHDTYPPLEAAIRFHHRLVYIHPFPNGNGRHARIMADAILEKAFNAAVIDWAGGHDLQSMSKRRTEYIAALRAADRGEYQPLFHFSGMNG